MTQQNKVIEVITKKYDTCEKDGKINKIARTTIHLSNGESVVEFGEARTWQAAGNRSLKTAVNAAGIITILAVLPARGPASTGLHPT